MKNNPIPVRMSAGLLARVRRAARRIGASNSAVIRLSLLTQLKQIEDGIIRLPECETGKIAGRAGLATSVALAIALSLLAWSARAPGNVDQPGVLPMVAGAGE